MKKNLFLLFALAIAMTSCKKDNDATVASSNNGNAEKSLTNPMHFTKKVLVEEFVGCNSGNAPFSDFLIDHEMAANNDRVYRASMHTGDIMQINQSMVLRNMYCYGCPTNTSCALINRTGTANSRMATMSQYSRHINSLLQTPASCGLAISSHAVNNLVTVEVRTQFCNAVTSSFTVTAYLVHENVTSSVINYAQANNYNSSQGNPFFSRGNPITPYTHQDVVFRVLTPANGTHINAADEMAGTSLFSNTFSCDMPSNITGNDCYVIAFATNSSTGEVMNVQKVKLGI